ncbi:MAG TPA: hypothetical protein VFG53_12300 [Anaeromyxobacter sp.]|nr:hypothetical protein [Anaeromyxobacter sp.]
MAGIQGKRVEYMGKRAVVLANDEVRTVIEAAGAMVPEFGVRRGAAVLNAHWIPDFRDVSGTPYSQALHGAYWKVKILYMLAGDFPCSPSFGAPCEVDGIVHPVHGWAANEEWTINSVGVDEAAKAAFARTTLHSPVPAMPLTWEKTDLVFAGQPAYFSLIRVKNAGASPISINLVRHNTLGPPFLAAGCRLSVSADRFMAAPEGTEFDPTGRLKMGGEFESLAAAPLRGGGTADLREVPGMIGYTDMVFGAVPEQLALGWSCVVNPVLKLAYVCFFPGMVGLPKGEIAASFNELWLQYGGRPFPPWAFDEGGADRTFCLGTENGTSNFGNGLGYARANPVLLGRPTLVEIPARGVRTLAYGTALVPLDDALVREGVAAVEAEAGAMVLKGVRAYQRVPVGADFVGARTLTARLERG